MTSHLEREHTRLGAAMKRLGPVEAPLHYGDPVAEHLAVRAHAGVADLSHRGLWQLAGPDAARFLQGILTNDIGALQPGEGCYALSLTGRGMIISEVIVLRRREDFLMHAPAETREAGYVSLDRYLVGDDAALSEVNETLGMLGLFGPETLRIVADVFGEGAPDLPDHHFVELPFAGQTILVSGASWTGENGYELIAPAATLPGLWNSLLERASARGGRPVGDAALDTLRLEAGQPRGGVDFDDETLPQSAGLDKALDHRKGCYRGQEIVLRVHTKGQVKHRIAGLLIEDGGQGPPERGTKLLQEGREVGWVSSAARSPTLGRVIALGYLQRPARAPGTRLSLATPAAAAATVAALPFYGDGAASSGASSAGAPSSGAGT